MSHVEENSLDARNVATLGENEEGYKPLFETNPQPMWVYDLKDFSFLAVNEAAIRHYGYTREEFLAMTIKDIRPVEDIPALLDDVKQHVGSLQGTNTWRHLKKDGTQIDVEITSHVLTFAGRKARLVMAYDVTERKRAEEALRQSEEKYRDIFDHATMGIFRSMPDGRLLIVNATLARMLGYASPDEILSLNIGEDIYMRKEDRDDLIAAYEPGGVAVNLEVLWKKRDGTPIWIQLNARVIKDRDGKSLYFDGFVHDITERKQAENALRESEHLLREMLENIQLVSVMFDSAGRLTFCNDFLLWLTGWQREEIIGCNWFDTFIPTDQRELIRSVFSEMHAKGLAPAHIEYEIETRKGERRVVSWNNTVVRDVAGSVVKTTSIGEDVTEHRHAEEALRASEVQLRQSQKMEAVGRLAGGIAHDFNNLLAVIMLHTDLMLRRIGTDDPLRRRAEEIKAASDRAATLTRQLLAFSRKQVLQPKVFDLNEAVLDMEKMLRRLIGEDIELLISLDQPLGKVKADPGQIEQVIMNLAVNARDAMPRGGKLTIQTSNVYLDEEYAGLRIGVKAGSYVQLSVSDNGSGMDAATQSHIFEPFFTTKELGKGTGLGLSTVYGIIKQSGGNVWVYSEVGQGTSFKIYLPRIDEDKSSVKVKTEQAELLQGTETILLVEDEELVRHAAREILEISGYTVVEASNGQEALEVCGQHQGVIHLLLSDVVMPRMGGRDLAARLTVLRPDTKVLFMSGYTDDAIVRHGVLDEGTALIEKPFSPEALARKIREVIDGS